MHSRERDQRFRTELLAALPRVRRFAWSLAGNGHDADDLLQSTVERVLARDLPAGADLLKWMFRVCRNLWIDELRGRRVRREAWTAPDLPAEGTVDGSAVAMGEVSLAEVSRAMDALNPDHRAVLGLVAVEGLSYREAAEVLEVPIGTVMSRLARARAALAERLGGTGG